MRACNGSVEKNQMDRKPGSDRAKRNQRKKDKPKKYRILPYFLVRYIYMVIYTIDYKYDIYSVILTDVNRLYHKKVSYTNL